MSYLLDTCVLSEFTKPRPAPSVDAWMAEIPNGSDFVSVLTFGELEKGIAKLSRGKRRAALERWLVDLRAHLTGRALPVDAAVAMEWGRIAARCERVGKPIPVIDALIGATAIVHGLTVVTRNESDIVRSGAPTLDPWRG